jgi:hypothetical protein
LKPGLCRPGDPPQFDDSALRGIDTVVVYGSISDPSSGADLFPPLSKRIKDEHGRRVPSQFLLAVRDVFSKAPWVSIKSRDEVHGGLTRDNIIVFTFGVSARQEISGGKPIKVGSLSLQIQKYRTNPFHPTPDHYAIAYTPIAYPFLIPDTEEDLSKIINEGVRFLTAHLPSYFICANNRNECRMELPIYWNSTRRPIPCPQRQPWEQNIPIPCKDHW